uniref:Uncharacterized protein n=1 Tax=Acrobeloides nanus TaxID=290746 RepID=A0A914CT25_9BILA
MSNNLDLFQQVIMESGTVLTCYDAVGPTHPSFYMAKYACNYTDEMWNSGNFGPLKDCLMKIDVQDGIDFQKNQSQAALQIFEDVYLPSGTADDDHMAWLQFAVDHISLGELSEMLNII